MISDNLARLRWHISHLPTITAILVVFNEQAQIGACLNALCWVDEIVVVDAFSTDRTVEICRAFGVTLLQQKWRGYSQQKQTALEAARGDWVLWVDADEVITPDLAEEIRRTLSTCDAYDGYLIPRRNYFLGRWLQNGLSYPDYKLRLFRRNKSRFGDALVHEGVLVDGPVGYLTDPYDHFSTTSLDQRIEKINRYSTLAAQQNVMGIGHDRWLVLRMIFRPMRHFIYLYFQHGGCLEGVEGLIRCVCVSCEIFFGYAKTWERSRIPLESSSFHAIISAEIDGK